jgi:hypothetical protein
LAELQASKGRAPFRSSPFGFGEDRLVLAQNRTDRGGVECGNFSGPGGVDAFLQGSGRPCLDARQRESGDLLGGDLHVLRRNGQVLLLLAVEGGQGSRVEGRQAASAEVVVDLHADRLERVHRVAGGGAEGRMTAALVFGLLRPGLKSLQLR